MGYDYTRKKVDGNHTAVAERLVALGWKIRSIAPLPGFFDLLGQRDSHGTVIFEIKKDPKASYTPDQQKLIDAGWRVVRLNSVADAEWYTNPPTPKTPSPTY